MIITSLIPFLIAAGSPMQIQLPTTDYSLKPGTGVQNAMRLLTSSSFEAERTLKILFYGQSISDQNQAWPKMVVEKLRKQFPTAIIEPTNLAIGGFAADLLQWTAIDDIRSVDPDLIIFQDYGGEPDYEKVIQNLMVNSHADLLLQSDHVNELPTGDPEKDRGFRWHNQHAVWLRDFAGKHGYGMVDVRHLWYNHLISGPVDPKTLMSDGIHPNEAGGKVFAKIFEGYLVPNREANPSVASRTTNVIVKPTDWKKLGGGYVYNQEFEGYRIESNFDGKSHPEIEVLVDGRKPSTIPDLYYCTRPTNAHQMWFPILTHIGVGPNPVAQTWTLQISNPKSPRDFDFTLSGSITGTDGYGNASRDFVSNSKRIRLDAARWTQYYGDHTPPEGMTVTWQTVFQGVDILNGPATPVVQLLAGGLKPGKHTLKLVSKEPIPEQVYLKISKPNN